MSIKQEPDKETERLLLCRNAGPEDLVATEIMLERITAPGTDYSGDFVREFTIFTAELRDFFNASSLSDMLKSMTDNMDDSSASSVQRFLDTKSKVDSAGDSASMNDVVDVMHQLTLVRFFPISSLCGLAAFLFFLFLMRSGSVWGLWQLFFSFLIRSGSV